MSDQGEKTCPLCAEEMDLTDQHLKPCKCGYEICVWCWHHIMDMAEKSDSDGRCPACRAPYNKEKIVQTASNCGRLVAEMNTEKKMKSNKGKSKSSEGRKHLTNVRVIQRNLVYLVGLPLNLADEDLLQRKEYFGRYGKVLKVSISRTATGAIQHFANNTCSVYITYSKEEEAICCIESVHEFILEGRQLRACFGTTKYCHAWLRNMPCINTDCLYLHEFGSDEDRFTKDEMVSAFSRSKVQQVTNSTQRRSGNVLPPPADEYVEKPTSKNATISVRISPPNSSSGRSVALPAGTSWGARASNNQPTSGNSLTSNGHSHKHKVDSLKGPVTFSAAVSSSNNIISPHNNVLKKLRQEDKEETKLAVEREHAVSDSQTRAFDSHVVNPGHTMNMNSKVDFSSESCGIRPEDDHLEEKIKDNRSDMSSMCVARNQGLATGCKELPVENEVSTAQNKTYIKRPDSATEDRNAMLSFDDGPEVTCNGTYSNGLSNVKNDSQIVDKKRIHSISQSSGTPVLFSGYHHENELRVEDPCLSDKTLNMTRRVGSNNGNEFDVGENTIISDILSLDLDSLDESSLSSQNFAKLLGDTDKKQGSHKLSTPWKSQHSNQSRFSFAREEEESMDPPPQFKLEDKFSSQIAAPPGFSTPKRAPPPGFTSYEKMEQPVSNSLYGNYSMDGSFLSNHQYEIPQACNGDVEFIDPAILAVGKGRVPDVFNDMRSRFSPHFINTCENNNNVGFRPQLLMQRSPQGYDIIGERFSSVNDSFRIPSRVVEQSIGPNILSPQYSGVGRHWDTWRDIQNGNNHLGMAAELFRAERLGGFNKFHTDSALRGMPSQGDLYNRTFGF